MSPGKLAVIAILAGLGPACGVDPAKIADHNIYADDGDRLTAEAPVVFAVVGDTRQALPAFDKASGNGGGKAGVNEAVVADITRAAAAGGPRFLVHLGDGVRASSNSEWSNFAKLFSGLIDGETPPEGTTNNRIRVLPVVGDREAANDARYEGWGGAFPGVGRDIGYNRVGSWYSFDLESKGHRWRFLVLDSRKATLGSRWSEQLNWLPTALEGRYDSVVVFMHDGLFDLAGREPNMNVDGAPEELLDLVDESIGLLKLRAVFFAGSNATQVLMPDGPFGTLYVGAGGGGAPAIDLRRWGGAEQAGRAEDIQLEPMFDLALQRQLDLWSEEMPIPEAVADEAKARGSFEGFTGVYDSEWLPTYGWWQATIYKDQLSLHYRMWKPEGSFVDAYHIGYAPEAGWKPGR